MLSQSQISSTDSIITSMLCNSIKFQRVLEIGFNRTTINKVLGTFMMGSNCQVNLLMLVNSG